MTEAVDKLRALLLQVRAWLSPHPEHPKGIRFEAHLPEVHEWMRAVDRETAPAPLEDDAK